MTTREAPNAMTRTERVQQAVDVELVRFAKAEANIQTACAEGRITPEKAAEKIERAEKWCAGRVAWITK